MRGRSAVSIRPPDVHAAPARGPWRIRLMLPAAVGFGLLLSIGQAAAQDAAEGASAEAAAPAAVQASTPAEPGRSDKVCRSEDVIGSRMKKRICLTPAQWEARERSAKDLVRELDGKPVGRDGLGG